MLAALAAARELAVRVGDNSNPTLDPDLNSYYLQDTIATKLPTLLGQLGQVQMLLSASAEFDLPVGDCARWTFSCLMAWSDQALKQCSPILPQHRKPIAAKI